jgi:cell division transport system permease protein
LRYCLAEAGDEWRHSPGVNVLATATLAAVLFVAGLTLLLLFNIGGQLERWRGDVRVNVYLREGTSPEVVDRLRASLAGMPDVTGVSYVDKAEALRRFRQSFGELAELPSRLGDNPLPASLEATLAPRPRSVEVARDIRSALSKEEAVEEVRYDQEWLDRLDSLLAIVRWVGVGLSLLVFAAVAFVMAGVMRLAVYARQEEVEIMLLVGAPRALVRGPFLVAGSVQGLVASFAALVLVEAARRLSFRYPGPRPGLLLDVVAGQGLSLPLCALLVAAGLVVSCSSAFFAVRRLG